MTDRELFNHLRSIHNRPLPSPSVRLAKAALRAAEEGADITLPLPPLLFGSRRLPVEEWLSLFDLDKIQ